jgi:ammonia channel protein AmtB
MVVIAKPIFNIFGKEEESTFDPETLMSCQLAGLVSISSSCSVVGLVSSLFIGIIASVLFLISKRFLHRMEIDDPLNIVSIHLVGGFWGLLATGIF